MGIDAALALRLIADRGHLAGPAHALGPGLMLGRQRFAVPQRHFGRLRRALRAAGLPADPAALTQADGYAETFLSALGFPPMQAMDASAYEGGALIHDLNDPVPETLHGRFGVILDGGTIEHVFNPLAALDNVFHMLAEGGVFLSLNGMTGWAGHGFYQFSPELVWRYWHEARGCEVIACAALPEDPRLAPRPAPDTGRAGARFRARGMTGRWYLYHAVRRGPGANPAARITRAAQGDYGLRWRAHAGKVPA